MTSSTINQPKESENQDNKLNQVSKTFDENGKVLPTSSANVEETIDSASVKIIRNRATGISATVLTRRSAPSEQEKLLKLHARPFDEFLVQEPNTDVPPEKIVNPNDNKSSFIQKTS
ncbi:unnamed protein product [Rotaria magnacalcarata]|uniref:Uncharacterized protein n=1 Tax=Rotaria magnacalcarata TaxID=392030 RepID=A0A814WQ01_9BILA|nr:unnamed protein product [Rotaria magnacalcarata]CAF1588495.1 unnamed protein product [Rotaria magnacalcarata]CAF1935950.1 unnamed protein product [Rotaria magnacalcarata]CAF1984344.1 unnamed protein product [Rotaria magnacalcarata]CAF2103508.1 unnamed protein product [Rotaria magnacalcarata]